MQTCSLLRQGEGQGTQQSVPSNHHTCRQKPYWEQVRVRFALTPSGGDTPSSQSLSTTVPFKSGPAPLVNQTPRLRPSSPGAWRGSATRWCCCFESPSPPAPPRPTSRPTPGHAPRLRPCPSRAPPRPNSGHAPGHAPRLRPAPASAPGRFCPPDALRNIRRRGS